jgi:hypothetical protein
MVIEVTLVAHGADDAIDRRRQRHRYGRREQVGRAPPDPGGLPESPRGWRDDQRRRISSALQERARASPRPSRTDIAVIRTGGSTGGSLSDEFARPAGVKQSGIRYLLTTSADTRTAIPGGAEVWPQLGSR